MVVRGVSRISVSKIPALLFSIGVIITPLFSVQAEKANDLLSLSINNVDADFTITGPKTFTKADAIPYDPSTKIGFGPQFGWKISSVLPAGTYTLIPAKVNGYYVRTYENESPNKTFTVPNDDLFFWNTNIEYAPTKIEVRAYGLPSDVSASFSITGAATYQGKVGYSGSWKAEKVPQGVYTLVWDEVPSYKKLEPVTITIGYFASSRDEFSKMKTTGISGYFDKKPQTAPVLPLPPLPSPTQVPMPIRAPAPEKEIIPVPQESSKEITPSSEAVSEQKSVSSGSSQPLSSKPQRNFFFRFWEGISSFFRRLF